MHIKSSLACLVLALELSVQEFGDSDDHSLYSPLSVREIPSWEACLDLLHPRESPIQDTSGTAGSTGILLSISHFAQHWGIQKPLILSARLLPSPQVILDHCCICKQNCGRKTKDKKTASPGGQVAKQGIDRKVLSGERPM